MTGPPIVQVRELSVDFSTEDGIVQAVRNMTFTVHRGETLAIVGESGCGKTATSLALLGLLPRPAGSVVGGKVIVGDTDVLSLDARGLRDVRGERMSMIFQDALTALNPVHRVGEQIAEAIRAHRDVTHKEAWDRAVELLDLVGIPAAAHRARDYVHQFSGGMRQRAMIALAVALDPEVLIADEPTTALDVTVQAQVLEVLQQVKERLGTALILITHDLGVVARMADRVLVMYAGRKVEEAPADELFAEPRHPYTAGLLASIPRLDTERGAHLQSIRGAPPDLLQPPTGCAFAARCPHRGDRCVAERPLPREIAVHHLAACHHADLPGWSPHPPTDVEVHDS